MVFPNDRPQGNFTFAIAENFEPLPTKAQEGKKAEPLLGERQDANPPTPQYGAQKWQVARDLTQEQARRKVGFSHLLLVFFITLGPIKVIPVFVNLTQCATPALRRQFAYKSAAIASFSVLAIALVGLRIAQKWYLSLPPLLMTSGVLLFLVSVNRIFKQYGEPAPIPSPADPSPKLILTPLTFPSILPPYGIALLVTILGVVEALGVSFWQVVLLVQFVMGLNLLAMLWARPILKIISPLLLQVVGIIMSVMQLALGISYIVLGIEFEILTLKILLDAQL